MTETIQDVLAEMDSAVAEVETANAEALKKASAARVYSMEPGKDMTELQAVRVRLKTEEARLANRERNEALASTIADLRKRGLDALAAAREAAEVVLYQARLSEQPQGDDLVEAAHRAQFVEQDVMDVDPADIPPRYELMLKADDKTGAWLWRRYGLKRLGELQAAEVMAKELFGEGGKALVELRNLTTSPADKAHKVALAKLAEQEHVLTRPQGEVELGPAVREFAATSGIAEKYLDPELVAQAVSVR